MRLMNFKKLALIAFFAQGVAFGSSAMADDTCLLRGCGGGTGRSGETVARQSGGGAALDVKNEKPNDFQSSSRFFVGGAEFAGGYTNLSTDTGVKTACSSASSSEAQEQLKEMCQGDGPKKIDAAAKVLGVPSIVLACIRAQETSKDSDEDAYVADSRSAQEQEQDDKAKEALKKQMKQHYKKIKGGGGDDDEYDSLFEDAFDIFWMLETVAKPMKQKLLDGDQSGSYWELVRFAVESRFGSREGAKQSLQSGGSKSKAQKAFAGVKKCIEEARSRHDSKSK